MVNFEWLPGRLSGNNRDVGGAPAPDLRPLDGDLVYYHRYRIVVAGVIGDAGRQAFEEFKINEIGGNTMLRADLDQSALFGALSRVLALGLELIEVVQEDSDLAERGRPPAAKPA
jgi:hypothetical protein